jgi:hypothetical protein
MVRHVVVREYTFWQSDTSNVFDAYARIENTERVLDGKIIEAKRIQEEGPIRVIFVLLVETERDE